PDEAAQLLLRRLPLPRLPRLLGGGAHGLDRAAQDLAVEAELVPEVIVDGGNIGPGRPADLPHRDPLEPPLGEQPLRRRQQPRARLPVGLHSVRLNRPVARPMVTAEKRTRNTRSKPMAPKPVFLRSRSLKACTA